jgi:hypothetical protein
MILHPHQRPFSFAGLGGIGGFTFDEGIGQNPGPFAGEIWERIFNWCKFRKIDLATWKATSTVTRVKWTAGALAFKLLKPLGLIGGAYALFQGFDELVLEPAASNLVTVLTLIGLAVIAYVALWIVNKFKKVL